MVQSSKHPIHRRQFEDWPTREFGPYRPRFLLVKRCFQVSRRENDRYAELTAIRNNAAREPVNLAWLRAMRKTNPVTGFKRLERQVVYRCGRYVWIHIRKPQRSGVMETS